MSSAPPIDAAREWLAAADPDPAHAYRWWESHPEGAAILPLGRAFDAVRVPADLAAQLVGSPVLTGPVLRTPEAGDIYVLVPPGSADSWPASSTCQCLGAGHYLTIPDPSRCGPAGVHWVTPPDGSVALSDPDQLATAIALIRR